MKVLGADLKTWDGKYSIENIEVTFVYFVPRDREPLVDWKERLAYFAQRIEDFHAREFGGQSKLTVKLPSAPLRSQKTTAQLRAGDGDFTFFQTLREADETLKFAREKDTAFPILLVLSEINWRPLDDFYRLRAVENRLEFEGSMDHQWHVPGAAAGGARATYLADRGVGWGLVSADGWRVPYRGSDCVVYHEGVGHSVGMPHPEPGNNSVMGFGQYHGWINESFVDVTQKRHLGWQPEAEQETESTLFTTFRALPEPAVPRPREQVKLKFDWPKSAQLKKLQISYQTDVLGPWSSLAAITSIEPPSDILLGQFDRPTPVSYRVQAELTDGQKAEIWGYFQVRTQPNALPLPPRELPEFVSPARKLISQASPRTEIDLLALVKPERDQVLGKWILSNHMLESPKEFGARLELPYQPPAEYELQVVAEPIDEPNGLLLGHVLEKRRFVALLNYRLEDKSSSALENVEGANIGNTTTVEGALFKRGRPALITSRVRKGSVTVLVDGYEVITWEGDPQQLSLSDYWKTPSDNALFLGTYDCRYRISRITLTPLVGEGKVLKE